MRKNFYFSEDEFIETISLSFSWIKGTEGLKGSINTNGLKQAFHWMNSYLVTHYSQQDGYIPEDAETWVSAIATTACVLKDTVEFNNNVTEIIQNEFKVDIFYRIFLMATFVDNEQLKLINKSPKKITVYSHRTPWNETIISEAIDNLCQHTDPNLMILETTNAMRNFVGKENVDFPDEYMLK